MSIKAAIAHAVPVSVALKPFNVRDEIHNLLKEWVACVNGRDLQCLRQLYADGACIQPTLARSALKTEEAIHLYFSDLLSKRDLSVQVDELDFVHEKSLVIAGEYTFSYWECGTIKVLPARFSFTCVWVGDELRFIHQQSSPW